jgi:uncharacterized protein YdhG (YjbR/CyaY superfamily)
MTDAEDVTRYLADLDPEVRTAIGRVYAVARRTVPEAVEGRSYSMPALHHRGKGLVAVMRAKRFLSIYPFSGKVIAALGADLEGFECTTGAIHFDVGHELPTAVLERLLVLRREEIDRTSGAGGS